MHNAPIDSAYIPSSPACSSIEGAQNLLRGIGVREVQKAAIPFQQTGILCRDDFANLDSEQRRELDGELKSAGITLGDRGRSEKADVVAVSANSQKDDSDALPHEQRNGPDSDPSLPNSSSSPTLFTIDKAYYFVFPPR